MATEPPNWEAIAQSASPRFGGLPCSVCSNAEAVAAVKIMLLAKAEGNSTISYPQMSAALETHLGFVVKHATLRKHSANCEAELWGRVRERVG